MRPSTLSTATTATSTSWMPLCHNIDDFKVRYVVSKSGTGDRTYSVQGTISDIHAGATAVVFDLASGKTADQFDGVVTEPITAIRLTTTAGSGAATMSLTVLQAGERL